MTCETERQLRKKQRSSSSEQTFVLPTTALISAFHPCELQRIWRSARTGAGTDLKALPRDASVSIPSFKVGSLEMYRRFPKQYDLLMRCHDCSAVEAHIHDLLTFFSRGDGSVRVADFGCGTGRIAEMAARHSSVSALYCYDSEVPMLRECIANITRTVAASRPDVRCIVWQPSATAEPNTTDTASTGVKDNNKNSNNNNNTTGDEEDSDDEKGRRIAMEVCVRPASFSAVQCGFLSAPQHPNCNLVVCAWALSYVMRAQWGGDRWHAAVDETLRALVALLGDGPGAVVIIETLGTGAAEPTRRNTLAERLEEHWGFVRQWVRTDYHFVDAAQAAALTKFFFGDAVSRYIAENGGRTTLEECTGIWTLKKP